MPRTHMLLLVHIGEERYIADAGFGGMTLTTPLRFELGVAQATTHEPYRIEADGDAYLLQVMVRGEWRSLYQFDPQAQTLADYQLSCWYLTHHPESRFVTRLIATRPDVGGRHVLLDAELVAHHLHGETERRTLADAAELRDALEHTFRLCLPDVPEVSEALAWVATGAPGAEGSGLDVPPPRPWRRDRAPRIEHRG